MTIFNEDVLKKAYSLGKKYARQGKKADYIPELQKQNLLDVAIATMEEDSMLSVGAVDMKFSIQSIVKLVLFALALENYDIKEINKHVGLKPSSKPFNSVIELELSQHSVPVNPFINAGAIAVVELLHEIYEDETMDVILKKVSQFVSEDVYYSNDIFLSEKENSYANHSLTYLMLTHNILPRDMDVENVLDTYFKSCSIMVNTKNLANMSYTLSNGGLDINGERIISAKIAKIIRTVMATCGTYDYSGEFAIRVGLPAKSGVAGGILIASPKKYGLAVYSPGLDTHGNSYSGIRMLEYLSNELNLSIY